jgi:hypothetical protein
MSLVGSLEDLGLGEILQIVSLSGKSGVLWIRSPFGEGRILFDRGAIRGAGIEGGPSDLAGLLRTAQALPEDELEGFTADAQSAGVPLEDVVVARSSLDAGRIDELRERHVEATVLQMFSWTRGEFSFEIRDEPSEGAPELMLRAGMNAQFLALEGTRLRDESSSPESIEEPIFDQSGEPDEAVDPFDVPEASPELEITVLELIEGEEPEALPTALEPDDADVEEDDPTLTGDAQRVAVASAAPAPAPALPPVAEAPPAVPAAVAPPRVFRAAVVVDRDLTVLEWAKNAIEPLGMRAHIFPRSELAIQRIRQYFVRGEMPLIVLSSETPADSVSGARDWSEIAARLRAQVPQLPLVLVATAGANLAPTSERGVPDAVATRPPPSVLADERAREKREALAAKLREAIETATRRPTAQRPSAPREATEPMRGLREWSARLRDPLPPSEVLRLVLEFASRQFDRTLVLWVREGEAQAMAQRGLPAAGGPDDGALGALCVGVDAFAPFHKVSESRAPVRAAPDGPSDAAFLARIGTAAPAEVFVAPIESGEQVAALLYGDNVATGRPLGDTSAIEVIVHEAGLALDRAVLERALEQAEGQRRGDGPGAGG